MKVVRFDTSKKKDYITAHRLVIVVLVLLLLIMWINEGVRNTMLKEQISKVLNYKKEVNKYKDERGKLITENSALKINNDISKKAIDGLEKDLKRLKLKNPDAVIRYVSEVRTDSFYTNFTLPCEKFNKEISVDSPYVKYSVVITDTSFYHSPIVLPDTAQFIVAEKKEGIFKPTSYSVVFDNKNPYYHVKGLEGYVFTPKTKFYNTFGFKGATLLAAFIAGFVLAK
ncbi:hypothetical protein KA025_02480 [Candidatus Saccharibacteria bacterium]|nr:hypothetical protein [Candidatus Saccharibacteria bacterium]